MPMAPLRLALVLVAILASVQAISEKDWVDESTVTTTYGTVQGFYNQSSRAFLGIPYMAPPVGSLRWAPPAAPIPWAPRVLQATSFAPGCPQTCKLPPFTCPETTSEDCMFLDIFTPRLATINATGPLPVMVYFPGGNFRQGAIETFLFDGAYMAAQGKVIVVIAAYRLGALGWAVTTGGLIGNYGLQDQRAALKWVRANIGAFGGNGQQITIWGQSAGATSIAAHLVSPTSVGLFERAISESNPVQLPLKTTKDAALIGDYWATYVGCETSDVACLRSKTPDQVVAAQDLANKYLNFQKPLELFYPWTPKVDGIDVTQEPIIAYKAGTFNKVPHLIGTVSEEALLFIYEASANPISDAGYLSALGLIFGSEAGRVLYQYPPPIFGDKRPLMSVLGTDYIFTCPTRNTTDNMANFNVPGLFVFYFNYSMTYDAWGPNFSFCYGHVCHAGEVPFVFHTIHPGMFAMTPQEEAMSTQIVNWWSNFAHTSDPNKGPNPTSGQAKWPAYNSKQRGTMNIALNSVAQVYPRSQICDFWDSQGYFFGAGGLFQNPKYATSRTRERM